MALRTLAMWALMSVGATATLTSNEQTLILNRHNKLRSETARKASLPKGNADHLPCTASDMEKMTWDTTLATEAQTYADQCIGDHPAGAGSDFGENLWMLISSDAYASTDLESGVQEWYDEIVDTVWKIDDPKGPQSKPLKDCKDVSGSTCNVGHYYQTIWAASNRVGCGVKKCSSGMTVQGTPYSKGAIMVCRYQSPASLGAGITHTPPFIFGKACAACPDSCEDGLCTKAPIRCLDKTNFMIEIDKKYTDCASIVAAKPSGKDWCTELAPLMSAEGDCPKSCKTCTVPANIGTEFCGAASGTTSGGTTSGGTTKTTDTKTDTTTDTKTDTKTGTSGATTSTGTSNTTKVATTSKYTGTISIDATGVTKEQVETASKKTLAKKLAVEETAVTTTATESRRLLESPELRRLAGSWSINFVITGVPAAKVAAIDAVATSLAADTTALKTEMATQLTAAGASKVAVDSLKVKSFAATKTEEVKTPAGNTTATTGTAKKATTSSAKPVCMAGLALFVALLSQ